MIRMPVIRSRPSGTSQPAVGSLAVRHPQLALAGAGVLGALVLLPGVMRPAIAIGVVAGLIAAAIAWRSVVVPVALGGVPPLVDAIFGSDPLPKGGFTLLFAAWIALALGFAILRRDHPVAMRLLVSVPVGASAVLLGLMLLRLGASPDFAYGSTKVQLYIADALIFLVGAIFVGSRRDDLRLFFYVLLAITAAGALLFLFKLVTGGVSATVGGRFSLSANEYPIELGRDSADGLIIAIYVMLAASTSRARTWAFAVAPALAVALVAAGSRGPVLAFVFGLAALLALTATDARARRRLALVAGVLLLTTIIVPLVVPGSAIGRSLSAIIGSASGLSSNGRSELWSVALATFSHHLAFGLGTGGFAALGTGLLYPHNILLEVATELGLVGAIALLVFLGSSIRRLVRLWRSTEGADQLTSALLISLFTMAFINACFSGAIQDNREIWLWSGLAIGMGARLTVERRTADLPDADLQVS